MKHVPTTIDALLNCPYWSFTGLEASHRYESTKCFHQDRSWCKDLQKSRNPSFAHDPAERKQKQTNKVEARIGCQYRSCLSCTSIVKRHFDITADSKGDNTNASLRVTAQHWICSLQTIQQKWFIFNQWLGSCFCQFHLADYQLQNSCEFKLVTWKNVLIMLTGVLPSMQCIWINSPESFSLLSALPKSQAEDVFCVFAE